jgi:hypothetical protein
VQSKMVVVRDHSTLENVPAFNPTNAHLYRWSMTANRD